MQHIMSLKTEVARHAVYLVNVTMDCYQYTYLVVAICCASLWVIRRHHQNQGHYHRCLR